MTDFEYKPPALQLAIEAKWPNHQNCVCQALQHHRMGDWTVRFVPGAPATGLLATPITLIVLSLASGHEMAATLYHEILHWEHPGWDEDTVERETLAVYPC